MSVSSTDLAQLLDLDQLKPDAWLGSGPDLGWGRIYGGQIVAQALRAATLTVPAGRRVHSLHAYFIRAGHERRPVLFEVERLRDGKSFSTRQVVASQSPGAIFTLIASFHDDENSEHTGSPKHSGSPKHFGSPERARMPGSTPGVDTSVGEAESTEAGGPVWSWPMPDGVIPPDDLPPETTDLLMDHRVAQAGGAGGAQRLAWLRATGSLGDDPALHACALAYLSDEDPLGVAIANHPLAGNWDDMMAASLDHTVWFHRPVRADQWLLFSLWGHGMANARGLAVARVHTEDGLHVATVAQEGLGRAARPRAHRT